MNVVIETPRLILREMQDSDAALILDLLNQPSFLQHIGDRGVRTLDDARAYIRNGPQASYRENGFGLLLTERRKDGAAIGMCGLLRRATLPEPDIGFAWLPQFCGQGYGYEAAAAALAWGARTGMERVLAIVSPANAASIGLLKKLRFVWERELALEAGKDVVGVYGVELSARARSTGA